VIPPHKKDIKPSPQLMKALDYLLKPADPLAPKSYSDKECLICREVVQVPDWRRWCDNAPQSDLLQEPKWKKKSDYQKKRKVTITISTWVGSGLGAIHYYICLQEEDDSVIAMTESYPPGNPAPTEHRNIRDYDGSRELRGQSYQDEIEVPPDGRGIHGYTRNSTMGRTLANTAEAALDLGLRMFKEKFGCATHFLVSDKYIEARQEAAMAELRRRLRGEHEGD